MLVRGALSALSASFGQLSLRAARVQPIASSSRVQLLPRAAPIRSFSASSPASATINQGELSLSTAVPSGSWPSARLADIPF